MKLSISNTIILICIIFTFLAELNPFLYLFWMANYLDWDYIKLFFQFLFYSFIHLWFWHLFWNSFFMFFFWNFIENLMWQKKYILFFISSFIFNWIILFLFSGWLVFWISWFCMALLSYATLIFFEHKHPDYKWWITALIIFILVWINTEVSFIWHLSWAIFGSVFYLWDKVLKKALTLKN